MLTLALLGQQLLLAVNCQEDPTESESETTQAPESETTTESFFETTTTSPPAIIDKVQIIKHSICLTKYPFLFIKLGQIWIFIIGFRPN